jgi:hypothetical protein
MEVVVQIVDIEDPTAFPVAFRAFAVIVVPEPLGRNKGSASPPRSRRSETTWGDANNLRIELGIVDEQIARRTASMFYWSVP